MLRFHMPAQRDLFEDDFQRPQFHFLPPANWMNDPNGVIQWNGQYHLFYQYNPDGAVHSDMHWGHAVSDDLIQWTDLPIALAPTPQTVDEGGIFSGCAVNNNGQPLIFYTGVSSPNYSKQVQCLAIGSADLLTWDKYEQNPIIDTVPAEARQTSDFRDPFVWQGVDDSWYMLVGSGIAGVGGTVFLYRSEDLVNWEYLNPLLVGDAQTQGAIWECPNFFELDGKWVLIISSHDGKNTDTVRYFVGTFKDYRFIPETSGRLDFAYMYAPLTFVDDRSRRLLWGWIREGRTYQAHERAGWAGVQIIPRELRLDEHNHLIMTPVPELNTIRGDHLHLENMPLSNDLLLNIRSNCLDITAEFQLDSAGSVQFTIAGSASGDEGTTLSFDASTEQLNVARQYCEVNGELDFYPHSAPHVLFPDETLQLRIIIDGSVCEIIANGRTSLVTRIYSSHRENNLVQLRGKHATVIALDAFEMRSIW